MQLLTLKFGDLSCQIAPEQGGSIYRFDAEKKGHTQNLMRPTWGEDAHLITDFASWPLVPFSNRIKHGKFSFNGKNYRVPVTWLGLPHASHGHGWERPWTVSQQSATACELVFHMNDPAIWPFPYRAVQKFSLSDTGLDIEISVQNTGNTAMPAGLGLHPYFPKPPGTTLKTVVQHIWEIDASVIPETRTPVRPEHDFTVAKDLGSVNLDHCFDGYGGQAEITWPGQPYKLAITSSANLGHLVIYVPPGQDFFCVEPVSHMPNAINRPEDPTTGLKTLAPGEIMTAHYNFRPLAI
jgi:aldose 1-epimerase